MSPRIRTVSRFRRAGWIQRMEAPNPTKTIKRTANRSRTAAITRLINFTEADGEAFRKPWVSPKKGPPTSASAVGGLNQTQTINNPKLKPPRCRADCFRSVRSIHSKFEAQAPRGQPGLFPAAECRQGTKVRSGDETCPQLPPRAGRKILNATRPRALVLEGVKPSMGS